MTWSDLEEAVKGGSSEERASCDRISSSEARIGTFFR